MTRYSEDERMLLTFLEEALPTHLDAATNLFARLAEQHRPYLEQVARLHCWDGTSCGDVVSETLIKGYMTIAVQMGADADYIAADMPVKPALNFRFEYGRNLGLRQWLRQLMLGKFGQGGVARSHNRRAKRQKDVEAELPEDDAFGVPGPSPEEKIGEQPLGDQIEASLSRLSPRQKFILTTRFGLGFDAPLTSRILMAKAKEFGMDGPRSISRRATHLRLSKEATRLNVQEIAIVLDISTKQVSRDMVAAYKNIRNDLKDWQAAG